MTTSYYPQPRMHYPRFATVLLLLTGSIPLALAQTVAPAPASAPAAVAAPAASNPGPLSAPSAASGTAATASVPQMPASMPEVLRQQLLDNKPLRVNGKEIPRKDIERAYALLKETGQSDTPAARLVVREELLTKELLRQAAAAQGLDKSPDVQRAMEEAKVNAMLNLYVARNSHVQPATAAQMHTEYDRLVGAMGPKEYKVRIVAVADAAIAQTVHDQAVAKRARFDDLARQYSQHASASRGGELDWQSFKLPLTQGQTNGVDWSMAQAMSSMKPGEISAVLKTPNAWVVMEMEVVRDTVIPSYDATAPALQRLVEKKAKELAVVTLVKDLVTNAKIEQ